MILPIAKKARLSAISLSKSLGISEDEARLILARVFNFKSWDAFVKALPTTETQTEPSVVHSTHQFMAEKLADIIGMEMCSALQELVKSISPFSSKPKAYRVDIEAMQDDDDVILDFGAIKDMVDDEDMMTYLSDIVGQSDDPVAKRFAEELRNTSFSDFQNRMRISHPIDPLSYANLVEGFLEWDMPPFEAEDIDDENIHGEPCFYWLDEHQEEHPVFITSLVTSPGNSNDEMFFSVLDTISYGYDEIFEKPILLFGNPLFKTIKGNRFSVIGVWNDGDGWRWLFLSKLKPWEQLAVFPDSYVDELQNSLDNPPPPAELAEFIVDDKFPGSLVYHSIAKPTEAPTMHDGNVGATFTIENRMTMSGVTGWQSYV